MSDVKAVLGQFCVGCVIGIPELFIGAQLIELSQGNDRVDILRGLVPEFVRGEAQG